MLSLNEIFSSTIYRIQVGAVLSGLPGDEVGEDACLELPRQGTDEAAPACSEAECCNSIPASENAAERRELRTSQSTASWLAPSSRQAGIAAGEQDAEICKACTYSP